MKLKISLIVLACLFSIGGYAKEQKKVDNNKPNVLIIFPDQLRRYSSGYWSQDQYREHVVGKPDPVHTPNIDKLANNGIVFTQAISNYPLCSPFRGMLLSGMYPEQNGITTNCRKGREDQLKKDITCITDLFYDAGYNTSYFGKCHWEKTEPLFDKDGNYKGTTDEPGGHYVNRYDTYVPPGASRHSIEYFYQALKDEHFNPHVYASDPYTIDGKSDGELHLPKKFSAKNESEVIISYLKNKRGQRDENKPFFMIWSLNPPHNPWTDKSTDMEQLRAHYDTDKFKNVDEKLVVRENADLEVAQYARHYFANVTSTDKYIGDVLNELEKMGVLDNTIVIFTSDHGEMLGSHGLEGKNVIETEAVAIPFIVHWPEKLQSGINDAMLGVTDMMPTIMGLAGMQEQIPEEVQGIDFSSLLFDPKSKSVEKPELVLLMNNNFKGVMTERYTLCVKEVKKSKNKKGIEAFIYDNLKDPYQMHKISLESKPKLAKKLLKQLADQLEMANDKWFQKRKHKKLIPYS